MITAEPKRGEHLLWIISDENHARQITKEIARNGDDVLFTLESKKPFTEFVFTMISGLLQNGPEKTANFKVQGKPDIQDQWRQAETQAEAIAREWLLLLQPKNSENSEPAWTTLTRYDSGKPRTQALQLSEDIRLLLSITWPYTDFVMTIENTSPKHHLHVYDKTDFKAESTDLNEAWLLAHPKAESIARMLFQDTARQIESALRNL